MTNPPAEATAINTSESAAIAAYYNNPAEWQLDANNTAGGFSIAYPLDFDIQDDYSAAPSTDWRLNASTLGNKIFYSDRATRVRAADELC